MKKFFTLIAFTCALVPALHGMEADVQKKHDHLIALIKNADVNAFIPAFDEAKLLLSNSLMALNHTEKIESIIESIKAVLALEQAMLETKAAVAKELEALGDSSKNWSEIGKGGLETLAGSIASVPFFYGVISFINQKVVISVINGEIIRQEDLPVSLGKFAAATGLFFIFGGCIREGIKNLKAGWNYKQHLQDQLTNLDAIAAHIAQAKEKAAHA